MAFLFDSGVFSVEGLAGEILPGTRLYWYISGTGTPLATYSDPALTVPNTNPVVVAADGRIPNIWLQELEYKLIVLLPDGTTLPEKLIRNPASGSYPSSAALAAATGSSFIGFLQAGTGAVLRTVQSKLRDLVNVRDFGAVGDGAADDTLAIQRAINSLPATGGSVYIPAGIYKISGVINLTKYGLIHGDGFGTEIRTSSATAHHFNVSSWYVRVSGIRFTSSVTKTGGAYVNSVGMANFVLTNFWMENAFRGVIIDGGSGYYIGNGDGYASIRDTVATTGIGIYITGNNFAGRIEGVVMDGDAGLQPSSGIRVDQTNDLILTANNIIRQGNDLQLSPGTGQVVASLWADATFFDAARTGITIAPTGSGAVVRCRFNGCWSAGHSTVGVNIVGGASSTIQGIHFIDPHVINCISNGINISPTTNVSDITVAGGEFGNNVTAILVDGAMSGLNVTGAMIGAVGGVVANSGWGIILNGIQTNGTIANNVVVGNTTGQISPFATVGANFSIVNNVGFNPQGVQGITVGASPFTYTAGSTPETVFVQGGTVSVIAINGSSVFLNTDKAIPVGPGGTVTVTYSSTPSMQKYRH